ncbi:MAG: tetratricopeptide repeat protein [Candidatus Gracilibacteria bacterium]|nr:tetratricopeptide repeat protein [Candidatus Gracilibacteria bacterium]
MTCIYILTGETEKGLVDLLKSYELNDKSEHTILNLANIYLGKGENEKAEIYYKQAIEVSNNNRFKAEALYALGGIEILRKNLKEAENYFIKVIKIDPKFELGFIGLGKVQFFMFIEELKINGKETDDILMNTSIANLNKAIELNPDKTLVYYQLKIIYTFFGKQEKVEEYTNKALEVLPKDITLSSIEKEAMKKLINN